MSGMTFILGRVYRVRLLGFRVRFVGFFFFKKIHLLEIISDLLEIRFRLPNLGATSPGGKRSPESICGSGSSSVRNWPTLTPDAV
jgi:hypothetical protein